MSVLHTPDQAHAFLFSSIQLSLQASLRFVFYMLNMYKVVKTYIYTSFELSCDSCIYTDFVLASIRCKGRLANKKQLRNVLTNQPRHVKLKLPFSLSLTFQFSILAHAVNYLHARYFALSWHELFTAIVGWANHVTAAKMV